MVTIRMLPAAVGLALLVSSGSAFAQEAQPTPVPSPVPEVPAPDTGTTGNPSDPCAARPEGQAADQSLSGQLSDCNGVLTPPPSSDTDIQAPAPDPNPGTTPVIPPQALPDQQQSK
ncbi:hypothetical protein [Mangrovicella endophytica]|uniref:hypothetical protein n=1 Tax=Mangrovicella endophytica TaxID=2066697 RepID=UPI000C9DBE0B|nr:hypothetical protein [Mangrovicella endophytica]